MCPRGTWTSWYDTLFLREIQNSQYLMLPLRLRNRLSLKMLELSAKLCGVCFLLISEPFRPWALCEVTLLLKWVCGGTLKSTESMWQYKLGFPSKEPEAGLMEFKPLRSYTFLATKYGNASGRNISKIVSDVHILSEILPENHRNPIREGFWSHKMANVPRISYSTLMSKFHAQIWSPW